jgi:hypothetical protein
MGRHERASSFAAVNSSHASGLLSELVSESNVYLGGSAIGKGLKKAARFYLKHNQDSKPLPDYYQLPGAQFLEVKEEPVEDPFYVVDLGVLVSQVYQWRRYVPCCFALACFASKPPSCQPQWDKKISFSVSFASRGERDFC